jgi:HEAT repeat protein
MTFGLIVIVAYGVYDPLFLHSVIGVLRRESFCQGRPASYWRQAFYEYGDRLEGRSYPHYRLREQEFLVRPNEELPLPKNDSSSRNVLIQLSDDPQPLIRRLAVLSLGELGERDEGVVAALIRRLDDDDALCRSMAAFTLRRIGPDGKPAVPHLRRLLADPDPNVRLQASKALYDLSRGDRSEILPVFSGIIHCKDDVLTVAVVEFLMKMHEDRKDASLVPLFVQAIESGERNACRWSISLLGEYGADAKPAIPVLRKCKDEGDSLLSILAEEALKQIPDR